MKKFSFKKVFVVFIVLLTIQLILLIFINPNQKITGLFISFLNEANFIIRLISLLFIEFILALFSTIIFILFKRIVTTEWGNFKKFLFINFNLFIFAFILILLFLFPFKNIYTLFFILPAFVVGFFLCFFYDKKWSFNEDLDLKKVLTYIFEILKSIYFEIIKTVKLMKENFSKTHTSKQIPFLIPLILIIFALLFYIIASFISMVKITNMIGGILFFVIFAIGYSLLSMIIKRILTTKWGNFFIGLLIYSILVFFFLSFLILDNNFNDRKFIFILILILLIGFPLFLSYDRFWKLSKEFKFDIGIPSSKKIGNIFSFLKKPADFILSKFFLIAKFILPILGIVLIVIILRMFFIIQPNFVSPKKSQEVAIRNDIVLLFDEEVEIDRKICEELIQTNDTEYSNVNIIKNVFFVKPEYQLFNIKPAIPGKYKFIGNRKVIFTPLEDFKPSQVYRVSLNTKYFKKKGKLISSANTKFYSQRFKEVYRNIFFNTDPLTLEENEVVAEIEFNFPVDINELKKNVKIENNRSKVIDFLVEPSNFERKYYIKFKVKRENLFAQDIKITISKNLKSKYHNATLDRDILFSAKVPEKEKLIVKNVESFPVEGNTFVAVLFSRPVKKENLEKHLSLYSNTYINNQKEYFPVNFQLETEYCYGILKTDFKPGITYTVIVSEGLTSKSGYKLESSITNDIHIKDLPSSVKFTSSGKLLTTDGNMNLEITTVNLDSFNIRIDKVLKENLLDYLTADYPSSYENTILYKSINITEGEINQKISHFLNLKKIHNLPYKGFYKITISPEKIDKNYDYEEEDSEYYEENQPPASGDQKVLLCTDIGIIAKESGKDLYVFIYSIKNLTPIANSEVKLYTRKKILIEKKVTDYSGMVIFKDWKNKKLGLKESELTNSWNVSEVYLSPYLLLVEKEDDFSYLVFNSSSIDQSRFAVGGTPYSPNEIKAFLTPERGVYRPGEKAYITAIVRKGDFSLPPDMNFKLKITDPLGNKFKEIIKKIPENGMEIFEVDFPSYALTGSYYAELWIGDQILTGETSLKVEEFLPKKIKAEIAIPTKKDENKITFKVIGKYMFGAPASGLDFSSKIIFQSRIFQAKDFKDYIFNDESKNYFEEFFKDYSDTLDENGEKTISFDIPSSIKPPSSLSAYIYAEVFDEDGSPVSASKTIPIEPYSIYYGIKKEKKDRYVVKEPIKISYVAVDKNGKLTNSDEVELYIKYRVYYNLLKKGSKKEIEYTSDFYDEGLIYKKININGKGEMTFIPEDPGYYTISLSKKDGFKSLTTLYVEGKEKEIIPTKDEETLSIVLNKEKYNIGETAIVNVRSAIPGKLFLFIEKDKIYDMKVVDLENNKATIPIQIRDEYMPNAYITAYVIRKPEEGLKYMPATAFGIKNLELNSENKKIDIIINNKETIQSDEGLNVNVKLNRASKNTGIVLFAVDEGILDITQFETPDPFNFFYKKIALQGYTYSIFDLILPDLKPLKVAIGGDEMDRQYGRKHINPIAAQRVKSLSLCSGILYPDENNEINYTFKLPQFNGKLRIMAIAADRDRFGSTSKYVNVSDPIVMLYSLPRILAPEDIIEIPVKVFNQTGKTGEIEIKLEIEGPAKISGSQVKKIRLANDGQGTVYFKVTADKNIGKATFKFTAKGNNTTSTSSTELAIRPTQTYNTISYIGKLEKGKEINFNITNQFYDFSKKIRISVSPVYLTKILGALDYLIQYPYGCTEQIVSSSFPLLYYGKLAEKIGYTNPKIKNIDFYINEAIKKIDKSFINDNFSLWPGKLYFNEYLSLYVCHFLIEANKMGYNVPENLMKNVYNLLQIKKFEKEEKRGRLERMRVVEEGIKWENKSPYALYLKALIGEPDIETMNGIVENSLNKLSYVDRCFLSMAYSVIGNKDKASQLIPDTFILKNFPSAYGGDFDSIVKRLSICLEAIVYINPKDSRVEKIVNEIEKYIVNGKFPSTHDNSRALMAFYRLFENSVEEQKFSINLYSGESLTTTFNPNNTYIYFTNTTSQNYRLKNDGDSHVYYSFYYEGIPIEAYLNPTNSTISITRTYFDTNGNPILLSDVKIGDIIVGVIELNTGKEEIDNVVIVDILPAGFEIENPRLSSRGEIKVKYTENWNGAYEDIRDDRLILFSSKCSGKVYYSYTLRATTEGIFTVPQLFAEAMYNPEKFSISKPQGKVYIRKKGD